MTHLSAAPAVSSPREDFAITTRNPEMRRILNYARKVAVTHYPVLIQGETGTGKELIARGIHAVSGRSGSFTPVNCSAIPETLFEAELFGARRGAFTGLHVDREGLFQSADGGTLFLDEIIHLPLSLQAKLLRVLQDGEVRPLGASAGRSFDVRILAACNRDLEIAAERGRFRLDLYFRLSVATIALPPLRDRPEDIPHLLARAAATAATAQGQPAPTISTAIIDLGRQYSWPGNVRELMHTVANAVLSAEGRPLTVDDFPRLTRRNPHEQARRIFTLPFAEAHTWFEREYMARVLGRAGGNVSRAAKLADLPRSTLRDKLRRHGLIAADSSSTPACHAVEPPCHRDDGECAELLARPPSPAPDEPASSCISGARDNPIPVALDRS